MNDLTQQRRRKSAILRNLIMVDNTPVYPKSGATTSEIHQALLDEGYEISKRTVQRDLEKLAEWAALDYESDEQGHRCWFRDIKKPDIIDVVPASEAFLLVLSEKLLRKAVPVNLSDRLEEWLHKADAKLATKHLYSNWKQKVHVVSDGYPLISDEQFIDEKFRKILYEGVLKEEKIEIVYQAGKTDSGEKYILNPLGLIIRDQSHYLVATKEETPEKPQLFLIHRILYAARTYIDIEDPTTFSLNDYVAKNPTGWLISDYEDKVVLRVKNYARDVLTHNKLANDQVFKIIDESWAEVSFTCFPTYDLLAWVLRYGDDVVVTYPESLKIKIKNNLMKSLNNYS